MWLNSTLVFLGDFRVFVQERWETGDIFGVTFFSGFPGNWRVWAKPCTDPSVDKRSRERRQRTSLRLLVAESSPSRIASNDFKEIVSGHRPRVACALASQRLSARSARDSSGFSDWKVGETIVHIYIM